MVVLNNGQTGSVTSIGTVSPAGGNLKELVTESTGLWLERDANCGHQSNLLCGISCCEQRIWTRILVSLSVRFAPEDGLSPVERMLNSRKIESGLIF